MCFVAAVHKVIQREREMKIHSKVNCVHSCSILFFHFTHSHVLYQIWRRILVLSHHYTLLRDSNHSSYCFLHFIISVASLRFFLFRFYSDIFHSHCNAGASICVQSKLRWVRLNRKLTLVSLCVYMSIYRSVWFATSSENYRRTRKGLSLSFSHDIA